MSGHAQSLPVLYSFRRCPYAMRARLALAYAGVPVEIREVLLSDKPRELLALSAKATVPVLQLPDGRLIDESLDVMHWALRQADPERWQDASGALRQELIAENDGSFKQSLDRYKYYTKFPEHPRAQYQALAAAFLLRLENCLAKNGGRGLVRDSSSLADMAIFPFVRQFAAADPQWFSAAPYPLLQNWLHRHTGSQSFARVMKKYAVWKSGGPGVVENWASAASAAS